MNSDRFNELLDRYLSDLATDEERDELMSMIDSGGHDEALRRTIQGMLSDSRADEQMEPARTKEILRTILPDQDEHGKDTPAAPARKSWPWYAVAAGLVMATSVAWWTVNMPSPTDDFVAASTVEPERAVYTGKQFIHLPDGSTVLLNEGSRLSFAPSFGESDRVVSLTGEGYFDVRPAANKPFRVVTGKITTTVLGTTFNVTAYPEQQEVKVTVTHGKVQVNNDNRMLGIIMPDQQISVNTVTNDYVQRNMKAETASAWQSQYLILDDVSLEEAAKTIAGKYNVGVKVANDKLKDCRISATFLKGENLDQVLTVVSGVLQASYTVDGDGNVTIDGKGCI